MYCCVVAIIIIFLMFLFVYLHFKVMTIAPEVYTYSYNLVLVGSTLMIPYLALTKFQWCETSFFFICILKHKTGLLITF